MQLEIVREKKSGDERERDWKTDRERCIKRKR